MNEIAIRFGITDDNGKTASTWKCWTHSGAGKSDVYLTCRSLKKGPLHASLHESGKWHIVYSEKFFAENQDVFVNRPESRFIDKWPRPSEIATGVTLAFRIVTPHSAINIPISSLDKGIFWIPAPPLDKAVEIAIIITSPNALVSSWPGKHSMNTTLVDSIFLDNGDRIWVVYRVIDCPTFTNLNNVQVTPKYFKGRSKDDLIGERLHIIILGQEKDGSRVMIDAAVKVTRPEKQ